MATPTERVLTGVDELDAMLGGGFMRGDAVMLAGSAGSGKTTLALQYLVNGAHSCGEPGIYVTFEELPDQLYRDARNFGWDLQQLEREDKLRVICTSPEIFLEEGGAEALLDGPAREIGARRIVVDSLSHLSMFVREEDVRLRLYRTLMLFKTKRLSSLLIWEAPQMQGQSFEVSDTGISFLVDAIVMLRFVEIDSAIQMAVMIPKMRGSNHDRRLRRYDITDSAVTVQRPFEGYEGVMSGAPRKVVEIVARRFTDWISNQPLSLGFKHMDPLCAEINSFEGVRSCGVRDAMGNLLAGGMKRGVTNLLKIPEDVNLVYRVSLMSAVLGSMPEEFGRPESVSVDLERIRMVILPLGQGNTLVVTTERNAPTDVISRIKKLISWYETVKP